MAFLFIVALYLNIFTMFRIYIWDKISAIFDTIYLSTISYLLYMSLFWSPSPQVADELVTEFADPNNNLGSPDQVFSCLSAYIWKAQYQIYNTDCKYVFQQQYDEKNIRRRVYDALNVLMAMDIISKDKKEIQWRGLPQTSLSDIEELKVRFICLPLTRHY